MSDVANHLIADLRRQREEVSRMIARAEASDLSYEHNDARLRSLERELERLEEELRELGGNQ